MKITKRQGRYYKNDNYVVGNYDDGGDDSDEIDDKTFIRVKRGAACDLKVKDENFGPDSGIGEEKQVC